MGDVYFEMFVGVDFSRMLVMLSMKGWRCLCGCGGNECGGMGWRMMVGKVVVK